MRTNPHPLPVYACTCGYQMDAATCVGRKKVQPRPGDFSLCGKCGEILVYNADMTLRAADLKDMLTLDSEEGVRLTLAQRLIRQQRPIP